MKAVKVVTFILTVIGSLNWGLVGLFKFDLQKRSLACYCLRRRRHCVVYVILAAMPFSPTTTKSRDD